MAQDFSIESEQPGMKRTKEPKKDGKKKKKLSPQDTGSESGKASPQVRVHPESIIKKDADGYSITVTPVHTGQEDFDLIYEEPDQAAAVSSPKDHNKGKLAARKPLEKTISYTTVPGSSQSVLTGKPRTSKPQGKQKAPKPVRKTKSPNPPGKAKTSRSSPISVSADVHNDGASEEAADEEDLVEEEESIEDEELSSLESELSEAVLEEEPADETPQTRDEEIDKRLSGFEKLQKTQQDSIREVKELLISLTQSKKKKAEKKSKARKDNSRQRRKLWEEAKAAEEAEAAKAAEEEEAARLEALRAKAAEEAAAAKAAEEEEAARLEAMRAKVARKEARDARRAERARERAARAANGGGSSGSGAPAPVEAQGPLLARMINIEQELILLKTPAADQALSFGDEVRQDPKTLQGLFEKLRPFLPEKIKSVTVTRAQTTTRLLKYFFNFGDLDSFWGKPNPLIAGDKYGSFKVLRAPTINKGWVFSSLPVETVEQGGEATEDQERVIRLSEKLQRAQPVECVDEEFNAFFAAASLTETKPDVPGCNNYSRYLTLEPDVFRNVQYVKFDGHTLLPSLELKTRKAVLSALPAIDLLKDMNLRSKSLMENWDKPLAWDSKLGLLDPSEEPSEDSLIPLLSESITKEQLRDELRLRTWGADASLGLLDNSMKILIAEHAEIKIMLRSLFMERVKHSSNQRLSEALVKSRLSSPGLFGKIPDTYSQKLEKDGHPGGNFPSFQAPECVLFSGPPPGKKKFQSTPSVNRGVSSLGRSKKRFRMRKSWSRGGKSQFLSSKNIQHASGYATTSRGSMRTTRGKPSTRGSNSRGGRGARGRGRGKKK